MVAVEALHLLNAARAVSSSTFTASAAIATANSGFSWGTIGDSRASGVAYSDQSSYDNNADQCLRLASSYTSLMQHYAGQWVDAEYSQVSFKACSGTVLFDMARGKNLIGQTNKEDSVLLMSAGGNDAGFANVVMNCVYQLGITATFDCDGALSPASDYINGPIDTPKTLRNDIQATYTDLFKTSQSSHSPFYLYHLGYVHYFAVDSTSSWCDDISFGTGRTLPKLTLSLRQQMNTLTDGVNNAIKDVISAFKPQLTNQQHLEFIDISPAFEDHRFCEGSMAPTLPVTYCDGKAGQYYNPAVWIWNVQYTDFQEYDCGAAAPAPTGMVQNGTSDDWIFTAPAGTLQTPAEGWHFRPFHPKFFGHVAIGNTVISQLSKDNVPGVKKSLNVAGQAIIPLSVGDSTDISPAPTMTVLGTPQSATATAKSTLTTTGKSSRSTSGKSTSAKSSSTTSAKSTSAKSSFTTTAKSTSNTSVKSSTAAKSTSIKT